MQHDTHQHPLQHPYDGLYRIINICDKLFPLVIKGHTEKVSIESLKAVFVTPVTAWEDEVTPSLAVETPPPSLPNIPCK